MRTFRIPAGMEGSQFLKSISFVVTLIKRSSEEARIGLSSCLLSEDDGARTRNLRRDKPVL